jgi:hypothetical protein
MLERYIETVLEHLRKVVVSLQMDWGARLLNLHLVGHPLTTLHAGLRLPCYLLFGAPRNKENPQLIAQQI